MMERSARRGRLEIGHAAIQRANLRSGLEVSVWVRTTKRGTKRVSRFIERLCREQSCVESDQGDTGLQVAIHRANLHARFGDQRSSLHRSGTFQRANLHARVGDQRSNINTSDTGVPRP